MKSCAEHSEDAQNLLPDCVDEGAEIKRIKTFSQRCLPPAFMYKAKFVSLPTVGGRNCYYTRKLRGKRCRRTTLRREHALVVRM